jgi:hypothetical protein
MPYMSYYDFNEHYNMSEPWDSPKNREYTGTFSPIAFRCPSAAPDRTGFTNYVVVVGPDTMWPGKESVRSKEVVNPDAILVVEYPDSDIPWYEPRDLTVEEFLAMLQSRWTQRDFGPHPGGLLYVTVQGEVRAIDRTANLESVRQLLRARNAPSIKPP